MEPAKIHHKAFDEKKLLDLLEKTPLTTHQIVKRLGSGQSTIDKRLRELMIRGYLTREYVHLEDSVRKEWQYTVTRAYLEGKAK